MLLVIIHSLTNLYQFYLHVLVILNSMMGGCPLAMGPNECEGVPGECDNHLVDIGGHWELKTTRMGVEYGVDVESGTGNDPIANKDDE